MAKHLKPGRWDHCDSQQACASQNSALRLPEHCTGFLPALTPVKSLLEHPAKREMYV